MYQDNDHYYDVLFSDREQIDPSKQKMQMSFADNNISKCSKSGEEEIKQTMADIGELLKQIYENSQTTSQLESQEIIQNEGVLCEESNDDIKISEGNVSFETNVKSILKRTNYAEHSSNNLIDTLNSATDKIIQGLQGLSMHIRENRTIKCNVRTPLTPNLNVVNHQTPKQVNRINTVVKRLHLHQQMTEQKIQKQRVDREQYEGKQRQPKINRQQGTRVPLVKRVDKILEDKQKWVVEQQKKKFLQEELYYKSLTFQPHLISALENTEQCFVENQKQWLLKKNQNLVNQRLEQESINTQPSFKPQICQKSQELLKKPRQYDSKQDQQLKNMYPTNRSDRGETVHQFYSVTSETQTKRFHSMGKQNKENE